MTQTASTKVIYSTDGHGSLEVTGTVERFARHTEVTDAHGRVEAMWNSQIISEMVAR